VYPKLIPSPYSWDSAGSHTTDTGLADSFIIPGATLESIGYGDLAGTPSTQPGADPPAGSAGVHAFRPDWWFLPEVLRPAAEAAIASDDFAWPYSLDSSQVGARGLRALRRSCTRTLSPPANRWSSRVEPRSLRCCKCRTIGPPVPPGGGGWGQPTRMRRSATIPASRSISSGSEPSRLCWPLRSEGPVASARCRGRPWKSRECVLILCSVVVVRRDSCRKLCHVRRERRCGRERGSELRLAVDLRLEWVTSRRTGVRSPPRGGGGGGRGRCCRQGGPLCSENPGYRRSFSDALARLRAPFAAIAASAGASDSTRTKSIGADAEEQAAGGGSGAAEDPQAGGGARGGTRGGARRARARAAGRGAAARPGGRRSGRALTPSPAVASGRGGEALSRRGKKAVAKEAGEGRHHARRGGDLSRDARVAVGVHRVDAARRGGNGARGAACACSADALGKGARPGGAGPVL